MTYRTCFGGTGLSLGSDGGLLWWRVWCRPSLQLMPVSPLIPGISKFMAAPAKMATIQTMNLQCTIQNPRYKWQCHRSLTRKNSELLFKLSDAIGDAVGTVRGCWECFHVVERTRRWPGTRYIHLTPAHQKRCTKASQQKHHSKSVAAKASQQKRRSKSVAAKALQQKRCSKSITAKASQQRCCRKSVAEKASWHHFY